jgi:hypothetical protein
MFNLGKKDSDGKQVRLEHRGKNVRVSRTGRVSVRAEKKVGRFNFTANSSKGFRLSTRLFKGFRLAFQNGRMQFIGRWKSGPLGMNVSRSGVSLSFKNGLGTLNMTSPRYSSIKVLGFQFRGIKAVLGQTGYIAVLCAIYVVAFLTWLVCFIATFPFKELRSKITSDAD